MARSTATPGEGQQRKEAETSKNELLMVAVKKGELTTVRRLVDKSGADVSTVNRSGLSCLQLAIVGGHVKLAEYLIQKGANIHSIDSQGWTALHDAAQMDMKGLVRKLISKGCNVTATTDLGELPIDVAGSVDMEKLLCSEMAARGEEKLSKDYEVYLGLRHLKDSNNRVMFPVSHRGTLPICYGARMSPPRLQRRHTAPAHIMSSQPRYPIRPTAGRQRRGDHTANDPEVQTPHEQKKAETEGTEKITSSSKLQEAVIDRPLTQDPSRHHRASLVGINSSRQHHAANSVTSSRRSGIGRSYQRNRELGVHRSSASISAALGVCFDTVTTAFEEDSHSKPTLDIFDRSPSSEATSAAVASNESQVKADLRKRKVSFCDNIVMARTKIASGPVATAEKERGVILSKEGASAQDLENGSSEEAYKMEEGGKSGSSSDGEGEDVPCAVSSTEAIANLKRKPRKSSIVSPERRRSSDVSSRRRSVTFQPEVLLHEMVQDGDVKAVQDILVSGVLIDINKLSPAGLTALHQSAIDGNLACAKVLVSHGADVNCIDCELWTPLHAAAMSGRIDIVRFLLSNGANPQQKNEANETAYDVAKTGPIRKLLLCAMNGKNLDADEISDGEYSDEEEQEYSHVESESDDDGEEPCYFDSPKTSHETSASPSPDLAEHPDNVFLNGSKSPDLDSPAKKPRDILDSTSSCGSLLEPVMERVKDLEETENLRTGNNHSSNADDLSVTEMISEDQGISTMDGSSDCSHRSRTLSEDEGTMRDVLDSELVPGSLDYRYQEACLHCEVDSLLKLVKHKAEIKVDRINKSSGITALHHAVLEENFVMVQHLVKDFECDIQIKDRDGWTPLHAASAVGDIRIAQFLLDHGAKASVLNNQCEFPVDVAEDEAMEKLLKNAMLGPSVGKLFKGKFA